MMCHQANDFQVTEAEWQRLRRQIGRFHADGRCVIFVGYEWSGMTPGGGDRNVMFRSDTASLHRSSHAEVDDMADAATDCFPVTELFARFRGRDDVLLIPHIGGRYADVVGFHDPTLEPVVEIYSDWGRFEWLLEDALRVGYKVGVVANSDGHKGRPGASHPGASTFGAYGGLTCVLAESLTREAVFEAVRARRCYGVSAAQRIDVELSVNGLPMGAEGRATGPVRVIGRVAGTAPLERIDVLRGLDLVRSVSRRTRSLPTRARRATASPGRARGCAGVTASHAGTAHSSCPPAASSMPRRSPWRTPRRVSRAGRRRGSNGSPTPPATTTASTSHWTRRPARCCGCARR
jgi:hypothetical protein